MKKKYIISLIISILAFSFFLAFPVREELTLKEVWSRDLATLEDFAATGRVLVLNHGKRYVYFNPRGEVFSSEPVGFRAAVGSRGAINYDRTGDTLVCRDFMGRIAWVSESGDYPFIRSDKFYSINPSGTGFSALSGGGHPAWSHTVSSCLTALSAGESKNVSGTLDGALELRGEDGSWVGLPVPESEIPVVYQAALSPDENLVAAVAGQHPQHLVVWNVASDAEPSIRKSVVRSEPWVSSRLLEFSPGGTFLAVESRHGVDLYSRDLDMDASISIDGKLIQVGYLFDDQVVALMSRNGSLIRIQLQSPGESPFWIWEGTGTEGSFLADDDRIYVLIDDILRTWELSRW